MVGLVPAVLVITPGLSLREPAGLPHPGPLNAFRAATPVGTPGEPSSALPCGSWSSCCSGTCCDSGCVRAGTQRSCFQVPAWRWGRHTPRRGLAASERHRVSSNSGDDIVARGGRHDHVCVCEVGWCSPYSAGCTPGAWLLRGRIPGPLGGRGAGGVAGPTPLRPVAGCLPAIL